MNKPDFVHQVAARMWKAESDYWVETHGFVSKRRFVDCPEGVTSRWIMLADVAIKEYEALNTKPRELVEKK